MSAYVHLDESQPHMHFAWTPVCYDEKAKRKKFNAKIVGSKTDLNTFHKDIDVYLTRELGYVTGVKNDVTEINMTTEQLKEKQRQIASEAHKTLSTLQIEKKEVKVHPITKKRSVSFSEAEYDELMRKHALELAEIEAKKAELELDKILMTKKIEELTSKPWFTENEELVQENKELTSKITNLKSKTTVLESDNVRLKERIISTDDYSKTLKKVNEIQSNELTSLEQLIIQIWKVVQIALANFPMLENAVEKIVGNENIEYCDDLVQSFRHKHDRDEISR